jgi:tRNA A37 threonylcarbamoyladenosine modification protein TsaB
MLIETVDHFLTENNQTYEALLGIVVVVGPGGFTGTRVTTLVANTLAYSFNTPLFSLTVGKLFSLQNSALPWITPVTKKEVLFWNSKDQDFFTIVPLSELPE